MENYFSTDELKCPCCGAQNMDPTFMDKLNRAREIARFAFYVNSGFRCTKHNRERRSTSTNHTRGLAVDLRCDISSNRFAIVEALFRVGMLGIGIAPTFIHCDTNRTLQSLWLY